MRWMLLGLLVAGTAHAGGLLLDEKALSSEVRTSLSAQIAQAKLKDPEAFAIFQGLPKTVTVLDAKKRGRAAPVSPMLKPLGERAVLPALELLAFRSPDISTLRPSAQYALQLGVLEALGSLRDPRSEPVLQAIVKSSATPESILKNAAVALGKLETDAAVATLVQLSKDAGVQREAAIWAFGSARRLESAKMLTELLSASKDLVETKLIVKMLGSVGSGWAWETGKVGRPEEEAALRELAVRTLIRTHLDAIDEEVLEATAKSILVVDAPYTPSLLIEAKAEASAVGQARLATLMQRFEHSPLH